MIDTLTAPFVEFAFMRQALRSSLKANNTTTSLGFRCAKDLP